MPIDAATTEREYRQLVDERKVCRICSDRLENASLIDQGKFDSDRIGPYTQWQGNLKAELMVVGQDFSDVAGFRAYRGWAGADVQTNRTLRELLACAGVTISGPAYGEPDDRLFFTNAVLCMKSGSRGGRQQDIPIRCFKNCSSFLRRTVEIVAPTVVVTLGAGALEAARFAFPGTNGKPLREVVGRVLPLAPNIALIPMYHPSPTVVNNHRSMDQMREDWRGLRGLLSGRGH